MRVNGLIGMAVAAAMGAGLFLPFLAWQDQALSLADLAGSAAGPNYLLGLLAVLVAGVLACSLTDDLPGLFPIGGLYLIFPAYALSEAGEVLGEGAPAAGGWLLAFAAEPAAIGAAVAFLAAYAAVVLGVADWWFGRARRRRAR